MINLIIFTAIAITLIVTGFMVMREKPESKTYTIPEGAQSGDLTFSGPCEHQPGKKKVDAECATLTVPENWGDPGSRLIALPVVRFLSRSSSPAEPVFILLGGPGASNLINFPRDWLLETHDVIMVGYRGVDGSVDLDCPEIRDISARFLGKAFLSDQANAELAAAAQGCADQLRAAGIDPNGFTAKGVIQDMEAARIALGYDKINLWSESYGTRVAQLYAYLYPESLHRVMMIGMNPPGHFIYDPEDFDEMIHHISDLYAQDPKRNRHDTALDDAIYKVNHNMPKRWLFFPIDSGTIRLLTQMMFFNNATISMVTDAYLAAADGDPSGLAMLNFIAPFVFPFEMFHMGDFLNKGSSLDRECFHGLESIRLGTSIMGAPLSEYIWPMAADWPVELVAENLRQLQECDVDMLVVNGTVDFSTPPSNLEEYKPYYQNTQTVLLPEFSHTGDVTNLQPEAFQRLVTSYYDSGIADTSLFAYQPVNFKPRMSTVTMARLLVIGMVIFPPLLVSIIVILFRRGHRK